MRNLEHFNAFKRTVARLKDQKVKQQHIQRAVQTKHVHTQQAQQVDSDVITTAAKLSDEQYKASIIALAISHIKQKWSGM